MPTTEASHRRSHAAHTVEDRWVLVERYVESFVEDDYRLVFKRNHEILEIGVSKEQWDAFDKKPVPLVTP